MSEMGWLRHRVALSHASRDYDGTVMMAKRLGFAVLDGREFEDMRALSSTLFILGSGESVEGLTSRQWGFVRRNVSIGINSWAVHDFVPDAYSFEEVESESYSDVSSTLSILLAREEVITRRPQILMLRPHSSTSPERIVQVPSELRSRVRLYGRTTLFTRETSNLPGDLRRVLRSMVSQRIRSGISLDAGMSVSRLITIGARAGFRKIVLIGVDLNSPRYFFDVNPGYWSRRNVEAFNPWRTRGTVHDTEETTTRNFPASVFIPALSSAINAVTGSQVFVSSHSSALASSMPVFRWGDEGEIL